MAKKSTALKTSALIGIAIYLAGPVIAVFLGYPDRRGPRVYPRIYHEVIFGTTYQFWHGEKPRIPADRGRPWFYGMERPVISRRWVIRIDP